ncbi:MAG: hypothetical protein JWO08_1086, partial [Verrucomicrobiaceae bacterium]|nr:hypothetical protein [Verrucomicrobiaceae bacterium]
MTLRTALITLLTACSALAETKPK